MSMKKILAAAAASVMAVSAVSVMASAADFSGEWAVGYADDWITSNESGLPDGLLGAIKLEEDDSITFTATDVEEWGIGVDKKDGWYQTDTNEGAWQKDGSITIKGDELNLEKGDSFCLKICVNKAGDNGDIKWEGTKKAAADANTTDTTSDTNTATSDTATTDTTAKPNPDSGVEGVAAVLGVAVVAAGAMVVAKKRK